VNRCDSPSSPTTATNETKPRIARSLIAAIAVSLLTALGVTVAILYSANSVSDRSTEIAEADVAMLRTLTPLVQQESRRAGTLRQILHAKAIDGDPVKSLTVALRAAQESIQTDRAAIADAQESAAKLGESWPDQKPLAAQMALVCRQHSQLSSEMQTLLRLINEGRFEDFDSMSPLLVASSDQIVAELESMLATLGDSTERAAIAARASSDAIVQTWTGVCVALVAGSFGWWALGVYRRARRAAREAAILEAANSDEPETVDLMGAHVLVAEDGKHNQRLLEMLFTGAGARVTIAGDGQKAVEAVEAHAVGEHSVDIVLMDIQMPVLDGAAATEQLRAAGFDRPIIALSAIAGDEVRRRSIEAGCDDFVVKPFNRDELLALVGERFAQRSEAMAAR
jgi:CheY-like chemotaxis protein